MLDTSHKYFRTEEEDEAAFSIRRCLDVIGPAAAAAEEEVDSRGGGRGGGGLARNGFPAKEGAAATPLIGSDSAQEERR